MTSNIDYHGDFDEDEKRQGSLQQLQPKLALEENIGKCIRLEIETSTNYVTGFDDQPVNKSDFLENQFFLSMSNWATSN